MSEQGASDEVIQVPIGVTCLGCGYALRGLTTTTCPECGQTFDLTKPWTVRLPGAQRAREMAALRPMGTNYRALRWLLATIILASAWFVAPHPAPTLLLALVWLLYALPYLGRGEARRRLFQQNPGLPSALRQVDDADVRRLRRHFTVALLVVATQMPFMLAYAISYPFIEPAARYWWTEVPADQQPPSDLIVRGVLVGRLSASPGLHVSFVTPTGTITFRAGQGSHRLVGHWHSNW